MALTNPCFKDHIWSQIGREPVEKKEGEKKRKRREEEEEGEEMFKQSSINVWKLL